MGELVILQPPAGTDQDLVRWLNGLQVSINDKLIRINDYVPRYTIPDKPQTGMVRYFGKGLGGDITTEGLYVYKSTGNWVLIA